MDIKSLTLSNTPADHSDAMEKCSECGVVTVLAPVNADLCFDCAQADADAAMSQAERMNYNMRTFGCIDIPGYLSKNVYKRHTTLQQIIEDGWYQGFNPEQTIREASNAGYARCVTESRISPIWERMDIEFDKHHDM